VNPSTDATGLIGIRRATKTTAKILNSNGELGLLFNALPDVRITSKTRVCVARDSTNHPVRQCCCFQSRQEYISAVRISEAQDGHLVDQSPSLLNNLTCPPIAMRPEWALRAYGPFRIIGSLFMRAADDAVRHHDRFDSVKPEQV